MTHRYFSFYFVYTFTRISGILDPCGGVGSCQGWQPVRRGASPASALEALRRQRGLCRDEGVRWAPRWPQLSDTARRMFPGLRGWARQDACEGQARPDGEYVLFPLFPITGGGMPESSGSPYRVPGLCRSCAHRAAWVGLLDPASCSPDVAQEPHPSTEQRWLCALLPQRLKPTPACKSHVPESKNYDSIVQVQEKC